jgi:hypothetical protein
VKPDYEVEDRLLSGDLGPADTAADFSAIATAIAAARGPAAPGELNGEGHVVAAMAAATRQRLEREPSGGRTWSLQKKAATFVVGSLAIFGTAGVAAAARGSLPGSTQDFISHAASQMHLSLPIVEHAPTKGPGQEQRTPTTNHSVPSVTTGPRLVATGTTTETPKRSTSTGGPDTVSRNTTVPVNAVKKRPTTTDLPKIPPPKKPSQPFESPTTPAASTDATARAQGTHIGSSQPDEPNKNKKKQNNRTSP